MIRYRPFENRDPPGLAEIWRTQRPIRGRMQAVTPQLLEKHVLAKPWFDRQGLIECAVLDVFDQRPGVDGSVVHHDIKLAEAKLNEAISG